eukprot:9469740-Pyramimonas_sp.AAC.1
MSSHVPSPEELEHERKRMAELLEAAPTFPSQEQGMRQGLDAGASAPQRARIAQPADQSDIIDLRQHINDTKQEFMGALAKVEESM